MMAASKRADQLRLPSMRGSEDLRAAPGGYRGDWRLYNDVISFFAKRKLGFTKGCEDTSGAAFVGALADTLFEILQEPRLERLRLRGIRMPLLFEHFEKLLE